MITSSILLLGTLLAIALYRALAHDGYGTRPAPRSHLDPFDPRTAHRPR